MPAKHRRVQLRFALIALLVPLLLAMFVGTWQTPAYAQTTSLTPTNPSISASPGVQTTQNFTLNNSTGSAITYNLNAVPPAGWNVTFSANPITVPTTGNSFTVFITPASTQGAGTFSIPISAIPQTGGTTLNASITVTISTITSQASFSPTNQTVDRQTGQSALVTLTLTNNSSTTRTFRLTSTPTPPSPGVSISFPAGSTVTVNANSNVSVLVLVSVSATATIGQNLGPATITALTNDSVNPALTATSLIFFNVTQSSPTSTTTPIPACINGRDTTGAGTDAGSAKFLLVNVLEQHGICTRGQENWFKFGAVGNKVYTIDVRAMDPGLDLIVELYDPNMNLIAQNDDFYARTPPPGPATAPPNPVEPNSTSIPAYDIRSRIQSWRAPYDGVFYIRVRDTLNIGGNNTTYSIIVQAESYGPTPVTVYEICTDLFEQDGLPEEATLIGPNETQPNHALCPAGDADWVKFFGKTGKTYYIYTDTRPFAVNNQTPYGSDTTLLLVDRDGITALAFNDDIQNPNDPQQNSLDSEIRFTPTVDGFYYAQVKNTGDIGNQFIRYDLTLKLCVPGQECGRSPEVREAVQPTSNVPQPTPVTPTVTSSQPTNTLSPADMTATATFTTFSENSANNLPVNGPTQSFVDPAFQSVWERNDRPVAEQRVARSWTWGPHGLMARAEGYAQAPSGVRQVEYFDKGRMEVNNPAGDRLSRWFVTSGLLVVELITGRVQVGDSEFVARSPADIPVAGDSTDQAAPRYSSFGGVTGQIADDRSGQIPAETLDRSGQVGVYSGPQRPETRLAHYVPESHHNIPQVFWDYLNARGPIYDGGLRTGTVLDWVFTMGYPISEPYWAHVMVGGVEREVLVQVFERRVLTYSPDNPAGWRVEQGNVGRHYYAWRYGEALP